MILVPKSNRAPEDTRSLLSLPTSRSKNFNYLMRGGAKMTTHIYANSGSENAAQSSSSVVVGSVSHTRHNNLPILHNLKKYNQRTALGARNLHSMTTMKLRYLRALFVANVAMARTRCFFYCVSQHLLKMYLLSHLTLDKNNCGAEIARGRLKFLYYSLVLFL